MKPTEPKTYVCFKTYDPYYGFKVIQLDAVAVIKPQPNGLARIEQHRGLLLGMIDTEDISKHFTEII